MRRIAFFGGSFDPPHRGHLAIAAAAADRFSLDEVLFAPVARQPLKGHEQPTPFAHRYAMTVLAAQTDPRFVPSLLDAPRNDTADRPNYTVETLEKLLTSLAALKEPTKLFTLLGADSWSTIARWKNASHLLALTDWIVAARPGIELQNAERALPPEVTAEPIKDSVEGDLLLHHADGSSTRVFFLPSVQEDISATELRTALESRRADTTLLPPAVLDYIRKTSLYASHE